MIELSPQPVAPLRTLKLRELALLREKQKRRSQNRIAQFYPETGPLRRELYPKHMRFFALGETHSIRGVVAANRVGKCISANTVIECPDGTERKVSEISGPHMVWAWNGESRVPAMALQPFTKPAEMVYRVWLSSGQWFDCAAEHRLLTESGWLFFSDIVSEDSPVRVDEPFLLLSPDGSYNAISCYQPQGVQPIYDFTVPGFGNYCTRGAIHHNTEGCGLYELTCHLTGRYPDWWVGARFDAPIRAWAAGDTGKTTRDILQLKLLGPYGNFGTGLMPADCILKTTPKQGVSEAIEIATFQHHDPDGRRDGVSHLTLKSYDQGRLAFQGTEQDVILLDEESDEGIRNECLLRLMTTDGLLIETFTPLKGLTPLVLNYMPEGHVQDESGVIVSENKAMVQIGWDDVPHLTEKQKAMMLAETPPHLIEARSKGIPSMGAGAIYPLAETEFLVDDLQIPAHWPRVYGMDVGWNRTAAVWGALDRDTKTLYLYAEYYKGQAEPPIHASAIKAKGEWIPGVIDPASRGRTQNDGKQLIKLYKDEGLDLTMADNAREAGLLDVWKLLSTGRLKVFKSLQHFRTEFRMYRRNENGDIVKENDHLMDATRYLVRSGLKRAKVQPASKAAVESWAPLDRGMGY